jgi:hypothetical protein
MSRNLAYTVEFGAMDELARRERLARKMISHRPSTSLRASFQRWVA